MKQYVVICNKLNIALKSFFLLLQSLFQFLFELGWVGLEPPPPHILRYLAA